jgi:hypothetical protein
MVPIKRRISGHCVVPCAPGPELRAVHRLIWAQSLAGAILLSAFLVVLLGYQSVSWSLGMVLVGALWALGFKPLAARSRLERPSRPVVSRRLPTLFLWIWGIGQAVLIARDLDFSRSSATELMANLAVNGVLGLTLLLRGGTMVAFGLPFHRPTQWWATAIAGIGFVARALPIGALMFAWRNV